MKNVITSQGNSVNFVSINILWKYDIFENRIIEPCAKSG